MQSKVNKTSKRTFFAGVMLAACLHVLSQGSFKLKDGLKFYTDSKDSSLFIKLNLCSQLWLRYTENNPSTAVQGTRQDYTTDASIRRIRLVLSGQLTDRAAFY